uniref:Uncharacterized protein n=1 Tax=Heterorhabditis bacteriophora TaxID=37862 RepID=A0A1I7WA41_HETBA
MGAGAQLVLLGRHAVPPTLSLHDFFHPLRAEQLIEKRRSIAKKFISDNVSSTHKSKWIILKFYISYGKNFDVLLSFSICYCLRYYHSVYIT